MIPTRLSDIIFFSPVEVGCTIDEIDLVVRPKMYLKIVL